MDTKEIQKCFMCEIVRGIKTDETIIYEDEYIQVVKDKNSKAQIHLLIYPKRHMVWTELLQNREPIRSMLGFAEKFISDQAILGQDKICLYMANCPRHTHLHMQIVCGQTTSISIDGIGTPDHHST